VIVLGGVVCPECGKVCSSELEFSMLHWRKCHSGPVPKLNSSEAKPVDAVDNVHVVDSVDAKEEPDVEESAYSLSASKAGLGELAPVLKDVHGNIIDGFHRKGENADWHEVVLPAIDSPVKLELARLAVNFCRRKVSSDELRERITFLVKQGLKPDDIANLTGINRATVYRHMPKELKSDVSAKISKGRRDVATATYTKPHLSRESRDEPKSFDAYVHQTVKKPEIGTEAKPAGVSRTGGNDVDDVVPVGTPICPCCGSMMNLPEFEAVKASVKAKFGALVADALFG
jgi:hypothetical protein